MINNLQFLIGQAILNIEKSNFSMAESILLKAEKNYPNNPIVLRLLGITKAKKKEYSESIEYFERVIKIQPKNSIALSNLGNVYSSLEKFDNALEIYSKSLQLDKMNPEVWSNKGNVLRKLKLFEKAIEHHENALRLNPDYELAWVNIGNVYFDTKNYEKAIRSYENAIKLNPRHSQAWFNLGNTYLASKYYLNAISCYEKGLELDGQSSDAWMDRGVALRGIKKFSEAIASFEKALDLNPMDASIHSNLGSVLWDDRQYEKAISAYKKALSINESIDWIFGYLVSLKGDICCWDNYEQEIETITKKITTGEKICQPFGLLSMTDDPKTAKKCAEIYWNSLYSSCEKSNNTEKSNANKIRIGFFSVDFREHVVAYLTRNHFKYYDRDKYEIYGYSLYLDPYNKNINFEFNEVFDNFYEVHDKSDSEISKLASAHELDIAVDMSGYTQYARPEIFSYRVAPIQVSWLGYPGTLGSKAYDYIIADKILVPPENETFYTEKIAYQRHCYITDDPERVSSDIVFTKNDAGLPENAIIFASFNNYYKFSPSLFDSWSKILIAVKNSIIWIPKNNNLGEINIRKEFSKRNIANSRIIFADRIDKMSDHLSRLKLVDIFLDPFPYNSHSTALDCMKNGVPLVTRIGNSFASRVAASILTAAGVPELIANSQAEYEALAVDLANDNLKLLATKQKILTNKNSLFDAKSFTHDMGQLFFKMHERYQNNLEPTNITLT